MQTDEIGHDKIIDFHNTIPEITLTTKNYNVTYFTNSILYGGLNSN